MITLFKLADKVAALKDKLKLWEQRVNEGVSHVSNISRDFERQRAWASVLRPCEQTLACMGAILLQNVGTTWCETNMFIRSVQKWSFINTISQSCF